MSDPTPDLLERQNSAYAEQVRAGFTRLRFRPAIESEFNEYFLGIHVNRVRFVLPLAAILTLLFILSDHLRLPAEVVSKTYVSRIAQLSGLLLVLVILRLDRRDLLQQAVSVAILIYGFSIPIILGSINTADFQSPIHAHSVLIVFCYFMAGLRFRHAVLLAIAITLPYPLSQLFFEQSLPNLELNTFFLLIFNALGISGAWFVEYTSRENFLNRQLLIELAHHDSLTALPNRRTLFADLERLTRQARRERVPFAFAMIDVDHFKAYNDRFGHIAGDVCLQKLAVVLANAAQRPLDTAGRYGGEEFALIWYDTSPQQAAELAENLRRDVLALKIKQAERAQGDVIAVSVGVCLCPPSIEYTEEQIVAIADAALYEAKDTGRNRVVIRDYSAPET